MNTYAKGRRIERKAIAYWVEKGYKCCQAKITKFHSNDFFGLFDFIAVRKSCPTVWVQVKANSCRKSVRDEIAAFARENFDRGQNRVLVMVWQDRKGWKLNQLWEELNEE